MDDIVYELQVLLEIVGYAPMSDLLSWRLVNSRWCRVLPNLIRRKMADQNQYTVSLHSRDRITNFLRLFSSCASFPYAKFEFQLWTLCTTSGPFLAFANKFGHYVRAIKLLNGPAGIKHVEDFNYNLLGAKTLGTQGGKGIETQIERILKATPNLRSLFLRSVFELGAVKLPSLPHLLNVKVEYYYPNPTLTARAESLLLALARLPSLTFFGVDFPPRNDHTQMLVLNTRIPPILTAARETHLGDQFRMELSFTINVRENQMIRDLITSPSPPLSRLMLLVVNENWANEETALHPLTNSLHAWLSRHAKSLQYLSISSHFSYVLVRLPNLPALLQLEVRGNRILEFVPDQFPILSTMTLVDYNNSYEFLGSCVYEGVKELTLVSHPQGEIRVPLERMFPKLKKLALSGYCPRNAEFAMGFPSVQQLMVSFPNKQLLGEWEYFTGGSIGDFKKYSNQQLLTFPVPHPNSRVTRSHQKLQGEIGRGLKNLTGEFTPRHCGVC